MRYEIINYTGLESFSECYGEYPKNSSNYEDFNLSILSELSLVDINFMKFCLSKCVFSDGVRIYVHQDNNLSRLSVLKELNKLNLGFTSSAIQVEGGIVIDFKEDIEFSKGVALLSRLIEHQKMFVIYFPAKKYKNVSINIFWDFIYSGECEAVTSDYSGFFLYRSNFKSQGIMKISILHIR